MPGIVGIISQRLPVECQSLIQAMLNSMKHESFYVSGTYAAPEMGVYGGWVAHRESFAAGQVFTNDRRDIALLFSGECFSDSEAGTDRNKIDPSDKEIRSHWLTRLYENEGERFVEQLNGLFSGLLIDRRQRKALLFVDRYGLERIYWHESEGSLYFASEAKALLRILPELRRFDSAGVGDFLNFGCTLEWRTLFQGVGLLPGGTLWCLGGQKCQKRKYFSAEAWEYQPTVSPELFESELQETFARVLPRYFASDSKLGISLTAGLDSRMIMACRPETVRKPICYTFSGTRGQTLDDRLATRVAEECGLDHELLRLGSDFFLNFGCYVDRTVYITDGAFGALGAHEVYFNAAARRLAPIRITGNYGSEIFRRTSTLKPTSLSPRLLSLPFRESVKAAGPADSDGGNPVSFAAFKEVPWSLFGSLAAGRSQVDVRNPYLDNELVALAFQCPEKLRQSPQAALRVINHTCSALSEIPTDRGYVGNDASSALTIRRLFSEFTFKLDYYNNEGLPHWLSPFDPILGALGSGVGVLGLHKYLHYRSWFRKEMADYLSNTISNLRLRQSPFWDSGFLGQMVREHIDGRRNYVLEINAVLTLEAVERLLFRDLSRGQVDPTSSACDGRQEAPLLRT
jgi:asparagine synthase (glutamine-hydrolysing)